LAQDVKSAIFSWESPAAEEFFPHELALRHTWVEVRTMYYEERTGISIFKLPTSTKEHIRTFVTSLAVYFSDIKPTLQYYKSGQISQVLLLYIGYDKANGIILGVNKQHVTSTNSQI
jgi:hypothetical protein